MVIILAAAAAVAVYGTTVLHYSRKRDQRERNIRSQNIAESYGIASTWENRELYQSLRNENRAEFWEVANRRTMPTKTVRILP